MGDNQQENTRRLIEELNADMAKRTGFNKTQIEYIMRLTHEFYDRLFKEIDETNKRLVLYSEIFAKEVKEIHRKIDTLKKANNLK